MRFVQWQQALFIIAPFMLLSTYIVWVYLLTKERSWRSVLLRLLVASTLFTAVWAFVGFALFILGWMGTSDVTASYELREQTHKVSVGLPFNLLKDVVWRLQREWPAWLFPHVWVPALPLLAALLLGGGTVVLIQRLLSKSLFSIERNWKQYVGLLLCVQLVCLLVFLWPMPSRNPAMASVPIPDAAVAVTYGSTYPEPYWPKTAFTLEEISSRDADAYYQQSLVADGWKVIHSESSDAGSGFYSSRSVFARDDRELEVKTTHGWETYVTIVQRRLDTTEESGVLVP